MRKMIRMTHRLACVTVALTVATAQEPPTTARPQIDVEQRFKQWDRNDDGKLTPDEVPGEKLFKMLDKNGDGVVVIGEANAFGGGGRRAAGGRGAAAVQLPPAENFKPREHGDEAKAAGLKPDVLAKIDVEMQRQPDKQALRGLHGSDPALPKSRLQRFPQARE